MSGDNKKTTNISKIQTEMLKPASFIDLSICAVKKVLTKANGTKKLYYPDSIGKYKLHAKINKTNNINTYGIATYIDNKGKKVFVKTWQGETKDLPYYALINEYNVAKIISNKIKSIRGDNKFSIPKPIGYLKTKNTFSILLEYVDGQLLSEFPVKKQMDVINDAISFFDKIGSLLSVEDKKYIKKRDRLFLILSLPLIFLYVFILEKENKKIIFHSFLRIFSKIKSLSTSKLTLSHGDLDFDNIFISGQNYYILDLEYVKYTIPHYELCRLSVDAWRDSRLLNILRESKNITDNVFLCLYIAIQSSPFKNSKTKQRPYLDYLKNYEK